MDMNLNKLGDSEGQGSLACSSPWGHRELDATERPTTTNQQLNRPESDVGLGVWAPCPPKLLLNLVNFFVGALVRFWSTLLSEGFGRRMNLLSSGLEIWALWSSNDFVIVLVKLPSFWITWGLFLLYKLALRFLNCWEVFLHLWQSLSVMFS